MTKRPATLDDLERFGFGGMAFAPAFRAEERAREARTWAAAVRRPWWRAHLPTRVRTSP